MQRGHSGRFLIVYLSILIFIICGSLHSSAQALLPNLSVIHNGNKNILSWTSAYAGVVQIGVQRSTDSIYNYGTIGYVSNPAKKVNSFTDRKPFPGKNFYRLYIRLSNGQDFFSNPAKSVINSASAGLTNNASGNMILPSFIPSIYVYTNPDGNVNISLVGAKKNNFLINFYDASDHKLFTVKDIKESFLVLDKSNFLHAGWFHFELFENSKLKERWRFYIPDKYDSE